MRFSGPRLRPGVHVVRRDDHHVQVGLDAPARAILPAEPAVLSLLEELRTGLDSPDRVDLTGTLAALDDAGLLLLDPDAAPEPVGATGTVMLSVEHGANDLGPDLSLLETLLDGAGVSRVDPAAAPSPRPPDVHLIASPGPLPRARLDPWVGEGAPHLVLSGTGRPGSLRLGPFVVPGTTACLRCVDAHEAALDPRRPLVLAQLAALPSAPIAPAVLALAQAWAARDLATYLGGGVPSTWSATVDLDGEVPAVTPWRRHPWCGCSWDVVPY